MKIPQLMCAAVVLFALTGCDLGLPPKPERRPQIPADAKLEYRPKVGWVWELCVDAPAGSALFEWGEYGGPRPFIRLLQPDCAAVSAKDVRTHLRVEGAADAVDFLFPEAPDDDPKNEGLQPCPLIVSPEALGNFKRSLQAAIDSGKLTPTASEEASGMIAALAEVRQERLWLSGGEGNTDAWSIRCTDVSSVLLETSPDFPEQFKTGQ